MAAWLTALAGSYLLEFWSQYLFKDEQTSRDRYVRLSPQDFAPCGREI
jgi:hypothetical protein